MRLTLRVFLVWSRIPKELLDVQHAAVGRHRVNDMTADAMILAAHPARLASLAALHHAELASALQRLEVAKEASTGVAQRLAVEEPNNAGAGQHGQVCKPNLKAKMRPVFCMFPTPQDKKE